MAQTAKYTLDAEFGCGLGGIFQCRSLWPRKSSLGAINNTAGKEHERDESKLKQRKPLQNPKSLTEQEPKLHAKSTEKTALVHPKPPPNHESEPPRPSDARRSSTSSSTGSSQEFANKRRQQRNSAGSADELNKMLVIRSQSGQMGNISKVVTTTRSSMKNIGEEVSSNTPKRRNSILQSYSSMGNIVRRANDEKRRSREMNAEVLKEMGNEEYKQGRFEEALSLYNQAIAIDPSKASYKSNKSAALTGLGRSMEAVFECREAVLIEPSYQRAHHRLATLYLRLGEAEKALYHYEQSGPQANSHDIAQAQALQAHILVCNEARKLKEWNILLKESAAAISSYADLAPKIHTLQGEALLRLHRHEEAYTTIMKTPNFDVNSCTKFFGPVGSAYLLMIRAQVYMSGGRFEDAVSAAQIAAKLDSSNEVAMVLRKARAVALARSSGNQLFKESKFSAASTAYSEGLEHDAYNSVLLCNRAACRSKLAQYEKAIEDCSIALNVWPSYSKARLRRADCNAKMERWEASVHDYEMLIRETPGDEEVGRALFEARIQLRKQHGENIEDSKFGSNLVFVSSNERFRHYVTLPGMSVVLFCNRTKQNQGLQLMEQVCKRYPSVNFLTVEIEEHPYIAKLEGVNSVPAFKIYKNGSIVKEIPGHQTELLENSVKLYSS
ncbi:hypothetical protein RJ641_029673 [Dillenia turbinata]|uniref:Thioredoxin domain-containing protein n=1 Tax=Dillenia turbinata TaxID=194707 RepID=A0AAN8ZJR0_9MAGN